MKKPRSTNHEADQQTKRADDKPKPAKPAKHRTPSKKQKAALMGFYAAAKREGGTHE